jgi:hypothetical protein
VLYPTELQAQSSITEAIVVAVLLSNRLPKKAAKGGKSDKVGLWPNLFTQ